MSGFFYALIASGVTFLATVIGSGVVFFVSGVNARLQKIFLGFSAGIMLAAAIWSLIIPATEMASESGSPAIIPLLSGFILGILFIFLVERLVSSFEKKKQLNLRRTTVLFVSVTMHNIPEGMVIGLSFALAAMGGEALLASAITLAIGMAIQNIPEGAAISLPLMQEGMSKTKAFSFGVFSGIVEPIGAMLTVLAVGNITGLMPYLLTFSAGAMVYVVTKELLPDSQAEGSKLLGTISFLIGFILMMALDVALA